MRLLSNMKAMVLRAVESLSAPRPYFDRPTDPEKLDVSLEDIAKSAERELEDFVRDGAFFAQKPNDLGDACIWQGVYTAMCVQRWRYEKSPAAKKLMREAAKALAMYPRWGVLNRGAVPKALEGQFFHRDPTKRYLNDSNGYVYRDDASLDSLLGFCYGAATIVRYGDQGTKDVVAKAFFELSVNFSRNGYRLINNDETFTKYGNCALGLFQAPVRVMAACLPSLLAGQDDWRKIAARHAPEFKTPDTQIPKKMSWVNAHLAILATLSYLMLTKAEDPGHREAQLGLNALLGKYVHAGNAFLIFGAVAADCLITANERELGVKVLSEFSLAGKPWSEPGPINPEPTPVHRRPRLDVVWQRSPYEQGGGEHPDVRLNRMDFLMAYYLHRNSIQ